MKTLKRKHEDTRSWRYHHLWAVLHIKCLFFLSSWALTLFICLQLKPLYKELLYTIAHKMGNPSTEVFTDSQLQDYIKEVKTWASDITACRCMTENRDWRFLSFYLSYPTRLLLWQSKSTTASWRRYRAGRWEKKVSMFAPIHPASREP